MELPVNNSGERKFCIRLISWIPAVIMMSIIFIYSSKPAVVSESTSTPIANFVLSIYELFFGAIPDTLRLDWLEKANFIVRKTAHITEFIVLALCVSYPLWMRTIRGRKLLLITFATCVAYASSDEFHQLFIEGRSGSLKDVGIDAIGCAIGSLIFLVISKQFPQKAKSIT